MSDTDKEIVEGSGSGDFSIGGRVWPGLGKVVEEFGETLTIIGKIIATKGGSDYWDGSNLMERLEEEIADSLAAVEYMVHENTLDWKAIDSRTVLKLDLYRKWHEGVRAKEDPTNSKQPSPVDEYVLLPSQPGPINESDLEKMVEVITESSRSFLTGLLHVGQQVPALHMKWGFGMVAKPTIPSLTDEEKRAVLQKIDCYVPTSRDVESTWRDFIADCKVFRHKKGGVYREISRAKSSDDPNVEIVVYEHLWPHARETWTRPASEFDEPDRFRRLLPE